LCHRVGIIDDGRIISLDTPTALISSLGGGILLLGLVDPDAGLELGHLQSALDKFSQLSSVKSISRDDGHYKIETIRFQEALMDILEITNQLDVRITAMEKWEPNLESVFLNLTGKKLRE
jgi:ABC-2 type transport system ATP-binding protein